MKTLFKHLGVWDWPFSIVPRAEHCVFIAGRPALRKEIDSLIETLGRRDTSSIHVLWSWYGAGKTHSLFYLLNQANSHKNSPVKLIPVYTEFPKGAHGFVDLYRAFMASFDIELLLNAFLEFQTTSEGDRFYVKLQLQDPDFAAALRLLAMGDGNRQVLAQRWLRGDPLAVGDLRPLGIAQRISTTQQATRVMSQVIQLLTDAAEAQGHQGCRLIWLIDEFQRAEKAGKATLGDVNAGLHSLFNALPIGFSPIISFSGSPATRSLPEWFSPELKDRIGTTRVLVLPPLQQDEAVQFVKDVLGHYRLHDGGARSALFPFSAEACSAILDHVSATGELRPRAVMHAFNAVLEAADPEIEKGKMREIAAAYAKLVLANFVNVATSPEAE